LSATAVADNGGTAASDTQPGYASASAGSVSFTTRVGGLVGKRKIFTGHVDAADAGRTVNIEYWDAGQSAWDVVAHAVANDDGAFKARWKVNHTGGARVRARVESSKAEAATAAPELSVKLYKPEGTTWYGTGMWGSKTACHKRLRRSTIGVAHKTLPCGTEVEFYYHGRTVTAPVIDRGPYSKGNEWDLTKAAADELGFTSTGADRVGVYYSR
jgi:rare lipoprotein A (peptidoglycan hydrolase)